MRATRLRRGPEVFWVSLGLGAVAVPAPVWTASPVTTTNQQGGAPVSTIAIPLDAAPGLYDLTSSVESGGGRFTGEHIVRIGPAAAS